MEERRRVQKSLWWGFEGGRQASTRRCRCAARLGALGACLRGGWSREVGDKIGLLRFGCLALPVLLLSRGLARGAEVAMPYDPPSQRPRIRDSRM
jgi:hypothetical protein